MTELERFAVSILVQWRNEGGGDAEPIAISALLDRVLPYRVARRVLGIDASEDYEAMMLRLLAEESGLVAVIPSDAAELARTTVASKLPDLGVLQLLRSASITLSPRTIAAEATIPAATPARQKPAPAVERAAPSAEPATPELADDQPACWSCREALPVGHKVKFCPFCGADQRQPSCSACGAPAERGWKHCAECGAKL
jgi:hypothetical protein